MDNKTMVSICCITYNQEKYIKQAIESFLMQKTNFKYEIIIHDDASTDNTANIIKEYENKYPDIIKPIYQKENQYSKGKSALKATIDNATGKYIAFCEGDDYWSDNEKLQKQFNYMESHPECSMCLHNTKQHDLLNNSKDKKFNNWNQIHVMTQNEIFFGWNVHTSSYFIKRDYAILPVQFEKYWFGDYVYLTMAYYYGELAVLPDVMSVYNFNNMDGITYKNYFDKTILAKNNQRKEYLIEYNKYTNNKFNEIVDSRINEIEFSNLILESDMVINTKEEFKLKKREIFSHNYYKTYIKNSNTIQNIKIYIKFSSYYIYKMYKIIKGIYKRRKNGA